MKKYMIAALASVCMGRAYCQNYLNGSVGLYGPSYNVATTIGSSGRVLVSTGGNWYFAGNVTSDDKGGDNGPTGTGRSETITFDGNGTYSNATTTPGSGGYVVNGYAGASNQLSSFVLPIGTATLAYPVTVPAAAQATAAFFNGTTANQSVPVGGQGTTEYSPYIDMPSGMSNTGSYSFSYPAALSPTPTNSSLLSSNNTSSGGTNASTVYSLLANVPTFSTTAGTATATISASSNPTQVYFGNSMTILPVSLVSFSGTTNGCTADLAWRTSSESNSSYYALEASTSGSSNSFSQVAKVASKNSLTGASYAFSYALGSGTNYFRLRSVDLDGKFTYSPTVAVTGSGACGASLSAKVSPNPTSGVLNIQGLVMGSHVALYNAGGQKLTEVIATGSNQSIDIAPFAKGMYLLRIQAADGSVSNLKVVKQ